MRELTHACERWLPVTTHPGEYEVSDHGRVRSVARTITRRDGSQRHLPQRVKELGPGYGGYVMAQLWSGNRQRKARVHTLVLEAFVGTAPEGMECRHRDGNPSNNHLSNLTWGTSSENKWDRVRHGNHPARNKVTCPRGHDLREPNLKGPAARLGYRDCLACHRARSNERYALSKGYLFDLQAKADWHYARIMRAAKDRPAA